MLRTDLTVEAQTRTTPCPLQRHPLHVPRPRICPPASLGREPWGDSAAVYGRALHNRRPRLVGSQRQVEASCHCLHVGEVAAHGVPLRSVLTPGQHLIRGQLCRSKGGAGAERLPVRAACLRACLLPITPNPASPAPIQSHLHFHPLPFLPRIPSTHISPHHSPTSLSRRHRRPARSRSWPPPPQSRPCSAGPPHRRP